jgi:hypothetical protein
MADERTLSDGARSLLDGVRNIFGANNVILTSAARSKERNSQIRGASSRSQHIGGDAFDFKVKGLTNDQVREGILQSDLTFGQLISETGAGMGPRTHLGIGDGGRITIASDANAAKGRRYVDIGRKAQGEYRQFINRVLGKDIGDKVSDTLKSASDTIAKGGEALSKPLSFVDGYILRGAIIVIGLILIIGSVILITKGR